MGLKFEFPKLGLKNLRHSCECNDLGAYQAVLVSKLIQEANSEGTVTMFEIINNSDFFDEDPLSLTDDLDLFFELAQRTTVEQTKLNLTAEDIASSEDEEGIDMTSE